MENQFFRRKCFRRSAVCRDFMAVKMKIFDRSLFERSFKGTGTGTGTGTIQQT
jgi:hypothetical protein